MPDREEYIEILSKLVKTVKESNDDAPIQISLECIEDILELLKEQEVGMIDKDKAVKGLSVCSEHGALAGEDCHGHYAYTDNLQEIIKANDYSWKCPYNGCKTGCVKTLAKDILALLKEPEAAEPKLGHAEEGYYICGNCHIAIFKHGTNYCHHCGRKIKWNTGGENESSN